MFMALTVVLSAMYRVMDAIAYFTTERVAAVPLSLYVGYNVCTWIIPTLPLGHLVLRTVWALPRGTCKRVRWFSGKINPGDESVRARPPHFCTVFAERVATVAVLLVLLPCWILAGEMLFTLKLFALGSVAERWWGVLGIVGVPCVSSTTERAHLRSNKLRAEDFCIQQKDDSDEEAAGDSEDSSLLSSSSRMGRTPGAVVSLAKILASANHRRKRIAATTPDKLVRERRPALNVEKDGARSSVKPPPLAGGEGGAKDGGAAPLYSMPRRRRVARWFKFYRRLFLLEMPRFDLSVDAGTLNRMVMLELLLKYIPQWALQFCITTAIYLQMKSASPHHQLEGGAAAAGLGWDYTSVFSACASFASLAYSASNMMHMWKENSWASTLPDLEETWAAFVARVRPISSSSNNNNNIDHSNNNEKKNAPAEGKRKIEVPTATPSEGSTQIRLPQNYRRSSNQKENNNLRKIILSSNFRKTLSPLSTNKPTPLNARTASNGRSSSVADLMISSLKKRAVAESQNKVLLIQPLAQAAVKSAHKRRAKEITTSVPSSSNEQ